MFYKDSVHENKYRTQIQDTNSTPLTQNTSFLELLVQVRKDQKYSEFPEVLLKQTNPVRVSLGVQG